MTWENCLKMDDLEVPPINETAPYRPRPRILELEAQDLGAANSWNRSDGL